MPTSLAAFLPFELESWQSEHEQTVAHNLADSSADSVALRRLVSGDALTAFLETPLHYPEVNGEPGLRETIAALYPHAPASDRDNVLVTVGAAQANAIIVETLCGPGSNVVVMEPGYRQVAGHAANRGVDVRTYRLDPDRGWALDIEQLRGLVDGDTALIYVCNPNNPTGKVLGDDDLDAILTIARAHGVTVVSDEVYQGSEHDPANAASTMWGRGDDVVVVNSLSKSYGLSGLRIGWLLATHDLVAQFWRRHEYLVISTGRLDNHLAELALTEPLRSELLQGNLTAIGRGWSELEDWAARYPGIVAVERPMATGLAFIRYDIDVSSVDLAEAIRVEGDVLVAPGTYFGLDGWFRLNFGFEPAVMRDALERIGPVIERLHAAHGPRGGAR